MDRIKGEFDVFIFECFKRFLLDHEVLSVPNYAIVEFFADMKSFIFMFFKI